MDTNLSEVKIQDLAALLVFASKDKKATKHVKDIFEMFSGKTHKVITCEAKMRPNCEIAEFDLTVEFLDNGRDYMTYAYKNSGRTSLHIEILSRGEGKVTRADAISTLSMAA